MPKFNKQPENARPLKEILPEMLMFGGLSQTTPLGDDVSDGSERPVIMDVPPAVRKIYDYIKVRVNDDVCITKEQEKFFVEDLKHLADSGAERNISALQNFVTMINSYRFECQNCLNRPCKKRDIPKPSA